MTIVLNREAQSSLAEPKQEAQSHLPRIMQDWLITGEMDGLPEIVLPHLVLCAECRASLRQKIEMMDAPLGHSVYAILEDAEIGAQWVAAGRDAAEAACRELIQQGIGYVYGRNGLVYRRLPNGAEELAAPSKPPTEAS